MRSWILLFDGDSLCSPNSAAGRPLATDSAFPQVERAAIYSGELVLIPFLAMFARHGLLSRPSPEYPPDAVTFPP